ncbi:MAG: aspartate kinase [Firmicutes bacterium]|nr:aspartate kinase [Bacillota bacterium]MBQ3111324.1 aspartate kinase [Bacillota bacterium]MBQ6841834.1 aspartate kinase [Bacillota bacterium]MBR6824485.1 aspartate kinase [Bacillota bacterium]
MSIVVMKFGGSSVANPERIRRVARRVGEAQDEGHQVVVIVSAMGDTTDDLIMLSRELSARPSRREMDMLLSTGEQQSIALLAIALHEYGYKAISLTGLQAGYNTDGTYAVSRICNIDSSRVRKELDEGNIVVVAGFQGLSPNGDITTLGRGGSDTSAVAMAIELQADMCEIYTDVDGVYTADPRLVKSALKLNTISYDEMLEMAAMGAGVLHPRSVELAKQYGMTLHVRTSFDHRLGTIVQEVTDMNGELEKEMVVAGVAHDMSVLRATLFNVPDQPGLASTVFGRLAQDKVNVDMIIQGSKTSDDKQNLSFISARTDADKIEQALGEMVAGGLGEKFELDDSIAKVSVVGAGMISRPGVAAKTFEVISSLGINIDMISTSEIKISCIVPEADAAKAVRALHEAFLG